MEHLNIGILKTQKSLISKFNNIIKNTLLQFCFNLFFIYFLVNNLNYYKFIKNYGFKRADLLADGADGLISGACDSGRFCDRVCVLNCGADADEDDDEDDGAGAGGNFPG